MKIFVFLFLILYSSLSYGQDPSWSVSQESNNLVSVSDWNFYLIDHKTMDCSLTIYYPDHSNITIGHIVNADTSLMIVTLPDIDKMNILKNDQDLKVHWTGLNGILNLVPEIKDHYIVFRINKRTDPNALTPSFLQNEKTNLSLSLSTSTQNLNIILPKVKDDIIEHFKVCLKNPDFIPEGAKISHNIMRKNQDK